MRALSELHLYDAAGRLIREGVAFDPTLSLEDYVTDFVYNLAGNRVQTETLRSGAVDRVAYSFNSLDQLIDEIASHRAAGAQDFTVTATFHQQYDRNGALLSRTQSAGGDDTALYDYDVRGQMSHAHLHRGQGATNTDIDATYRYDHDGLRIGETVSTSLDGSAPVGEVRTRLLDKMNPTGYSQVLEEFTGASANQQSLTASYLLGRSVLGQSTAAHGPVDLLTDAHGNTRLVVDATGLIVDRFTYDVYGNLLGSTLITPATNVLYSGERWDCPSRKRLPRDERGTR